MRKYIIGGIVGFMLAFAVTAHAEVTDMIGKAVEGTFPFKINGKKISQDVIVIQGVSYIPVRAASELFGYDIDFDDVNKEVLMQAKAYKGLSDFEKASLNMPTYFIQTNLPLISDKEHKMELLKVDGESYIPISPTFAKYADWDGNTMTIKYDGKTVVGTKANDKYVKGIDILMYGGGSFVKLSALGLKATPQGDTLIIDKQ